MVSRPPQAAQEPLIANCIFALRRKLFQHYRHSVPMHLEMVHMLIERKPFSRPSFRERGPQVSLNQELEPCALQRESGDLNALHIHPSPAVVWTQTAQLR